MYSLELARANADELLREARRSRGLDSAPTTDRSRFVSLRRFNR